MKAAMSVLLVAVVAPFQSPQPASWKLAGIVLRHDVEAVEDSALLLTIEWVGKRETETA